MNLYPTFDSEELDSVNEYFNESCSANDTTALLLIDRGCCHADRYSDDFFMWAFVTALASAFAFVTSITLYIVAHCAQLDTRLLNERRRWWQLFRCFIGIPFLVLVASIICWASAALVAVRTNYHDLEYWARREASAWTMVYTSGWTFMLICCVMLIIVFVIARMWHTWAHSRKKFENGYYCENNIFILSDDEIYLQERKKFSEQTVSKERKLQNFEITIASKKALLN